MKSKTLKTITIILTILSVIGSFFIPTLSEEYNVSLMFYLLIGTFIYAAYAFAMCQALANTEKNQKYFEKIIDNQKALRQIIIQNNGKTYSSEKKEDKLEAITCPNCSTKQNANRNICFNCGTKLK